MKGYYYHEDREDVYGMEFIKTMKIMKRDKMEAVQQALNALMQEEELIASYSLQNEGVNVVIKETRQEIFVPWIEHDITEEKELKSFLKKTILHRITEEGILDEGMLFGVHEFLSRCTFIPIRLSRGVVGRVTYPFMTQMKNGAWAEVEQTDSLLNVFFESVNGEFAFLTTDFLKRSPLDRQGLWDELQRRLQRDATNIPSLLEEERERFLTMSNAKLDRQLSFGISYTRNDVVHPAALLMMSSDLSIMRNSLVRKRSNRICMISFNLRNVQFFEMGKSDSLVGTLISVFAEFATELPLTNSIPKSEDLGWNSELIYYEFLPSGKWKEHSLTREEYNFVWMGLENRLSKDRFRFFLRAMQGQVQKIRGFQ